jgi:hypothetical protein
MLITLEWNERALAGMRGLVKLWRQVEAVDSVKKEKCPDPLIKVLALPPEDLQGAGLVPELFCREGGASLFQRAVTQVRITRGDNVEQVNHRK